MKSACILCGSKSSEAEQNVIFAFLNQKWNTLTLVWNTTEYKKKNCQKNRTKKTGKGKTLKKIELSFSS